MEAFLKHSRWNAALLRAIQICEQEVEQQLQAISPMYYLAEEELPPNEVETMRKDKTYGILLRFIESYYDAYTHTLRSAAPGLSMKKAERFLHQLEDELREGRSKLVYELAKYEL